MKHAVRSVVAAFATAALVAPGGSAHAEKEYVDDPVGDVWQGSYHDTEPWQRIGTRANVDIDRSVIRHRKRDVVATIAFETLRKQGDRYVAGWKLRTDVGREFLVGVDAESGRWAGGLSLFDLNPPPEEGQPEDRIELLECDGAHQVDYTADRLKIWLPRTCIGEPEWIQGMPLGESHTDDGTTSVRDNGHIRGYRLRGWTDSLSIG